MANRGYTGAQLSLMEIGEVPVLFVFGPKPFAIKDPDTDTVADLLEEIWEQAVEEPMFWCHWTEKPFPGDVIES